MSNNKEEVERRRNEGVTPSIERLDKIAISVRSHKLLRELLNENPELEEIMRNSKNETEALVGVRNWVVAYLQSSPAALEYDKDEGGGRETFESLQWTDYAGIRLLDYIDNAGTLVSAKIRGGHG